MKLIAEQTGMDYETLIGGEYKILLEPIAYYKYEGVMIATTATEAAMCDGSRQWSPANMDGQPDPQEPATLDVFGNGQT